MRNSYTVGFGIWKSAFHLRQMIAANARNVYFSARWSFDSVAKDFGNESFTLAVQLLTRAELNFSMSFALCEPSGKHFAPMFFVFSADYVTATGFF